MANITTYSAFNLNNLNLGLLYTNYVYSYFSNDAHYTFGGVTYEDVLEIEYYYGGYYSTIFGGSGISVSSDGIPTGGTVTGFLDGSYSGGDFYYYYQVSGIAMSAVAIFNASATASTADDAALMVQALSGVDVFSLSAYADDVRGFGGNDRISGNGGDDTLRGDGGNDLVNGGAGADRLFGGGGRDRVNGQSGNDDLNGGGGADRLSGGSGDDLLLGQNGRDVLKGNRGNDTLNGGGGDDRLVGGGGRDVFVFGRNSGEDTIRDFNDARDQIEITSGARRYGQLDFSDSGDDVVVRFAQTTLILEDVEIADLTRDVFDFV
ncbi:calcium-binding protein [Tritonibacter horizontis]|uniref:RTX-I toxin determinant A from serotypes 1/9 n=1 Tax=Tritonibacter horizontis TaxID=1768241 RepID=A0A132BVC9_9RHOB|nr:calcium-binding protein [Tritonibacter horizontis]KUP92348.1 RTX-I toxin determinant A from serotypes 1/9 [Tritonibacter horizontis]